MFADDAVAVEAGCRKQAPRDRLHLVVDNMVVLLEEVYLTESNQELEPRTDTVEDKAIHKLEDIVMDLNTVEVVRKMWNLEERLQLEETSNHVKRHLQLVRHSDCRIAYYCCHSPFCDQKSKS